MLVITPDVELWATGWIRAALAARPEPYAAVNSVGLKVPTTRPARFITVRRDGGGRLDAVRELARMSINVWAGTDKDATDLARLTAALLMTAAHGNPVVRVDLMSGPLTIDDVQPRRLLSFELIVRGSDL